MNRKSCQLVVLAALLLLAGHVLAETKKFVYVYTADGELLSPMSPASICPDPVTFETQTDACKGVEVGSDGQYNLALKTDVLAERVSIVLVVHRVEVLNHAGDFQFMLLGSHRRVNRIVANKINDNLHVDAVSEALVRAVEKAERVVLGSTVPEGQRASNHIRSVDVNALNTLLSASVPDSTGPAAWIAAQTDDLSSDQEQALADLAGLALENHDDELAQFLLIRNLTQGLLDPRNLDSLVDQTATQINAIGMSEGTGVMVLTADTYMVSIGQVVELSTARSVHADNFFGYSWTGVQSDGHHATFQKDLPGLYTVCVTGEAVNVLDNSTDCIRLLVTEPAVAIVQTEKTQLGSGEIIWLSGENSIGAVTYQWSGDGGFAQIDQSRVFWTAPQEEGEYTVHLTVNGTAHATATVQVINARPICALFTDKRIIYTSDPDAVATLISLARTSDGSKLDSIDWAVVAQPVGSHPVLSSVDQSITQFTSTDPGVYTIQLTAYRNGLNHSKTVDILVLQRHAPIALAGNDRVAFRHQAVPLDGSRSYDPDGDTLGFL